jgi:hypothetical protein
MKRFWLVLLSLGLVLAFSASAMAVDVKFSGDFTIGGMYVDKTRLVKNEGSMDDGPSTGFFYQRLRLRTDFVVAPGLSFVTRADIMSRVWGGKRSTNVDNEGLQGSGIVVRPGSTYESENIVFDWAYISYTSPVGLFMVGYQKDNTWGTVFNDSETPAPAIQYVLPIGQFVLIAKYSKGDDNSIHRGSLSALPRYQHTDYDQDQYVLAGIYNFKNGSVGLLGKYIRLEDVYRSMSDFGRQDGIELTAFALSPYAKFKLGPVAIQTELAYFHGTIDKLDRKDGNTTGVYDNIGVSMRGERTAKDIELDALAFWVDAVADFDKFYVGGSVAYISGDDPDTADKVEGIFLNGGNDWNPTLLMWNYERTYWQGSIYGYDAAGQNGPMGTDAAGGPTVGAKFYQIRAGVRPTPAWDIMASLSYGKAAEKPGRLRDRHAGDELDEARIERFQSSTFGYEVDVTATYKITNNLSYMLGAGKMYTGDYYLGYNHDGHNSTVNNYILINKLTLTF